MKNLLRLAALRASLEIIFHKCQSPLSIYMGLKARARASQLYQCKRTIKYNQCDRCLIVSTHFRFCTMFYFVSFLSRFGVRKKHSEFTFWRWMRTDTTAPNWLAFKSKCVYFDCISLTLRAFLYKFIKRI